MFDDVNEAWSRAHELLARSAVDSLLESFGGEPADPSERNVARGVVSDIVGDRNSMIEQYLKHASDRAEIAVRYLEAAANAGSEDGSSPSAVVHENVELLLREPRARERVPDPMRSMRGRNNEKPMRGGGIRLSHDAVRLLSSWLRVIARSRDVRVD